MVFPVYAWGLPGIVKEFIEHTLPTLVDGGVEYIYAVMTCGDDMGYTDRLVDKALRRGGMTLSAAFSVLMPNTYVSLPGFDVDTPEVERAKMDAMPGRVEEIARAIKERRKIIDVRRGAFPHLKTYAIRPLFNRFLMSDKYFHVMPERCIGCGECARQCPVGNIAMGPNKVPSWMGKDCTGCLGCYHACPRNAVQYGKWTKGKGQKRVQH